MARWHRRRGGRKADRTEGVMHEGEAIAALAPFIGTLAFRRRQRVGKVLTTAPSYSPVRVLITEEELRAAILQAVRFEEVAAVALEARTRRHQRWLPRAEVDRS